MSVTVGELNAKMGMDSSAFSAGLSTAMLGIAGVGLAVAGVAAKGLKEFTQLETGMAEVFTLMPGITETAMNEMTGQVRDFAVEFGTLPEDVVPALYDSISAGVPSGNVFDFLEVAQRAARGGVTDLGTAVDGLTSTVNAYGEENVNASEASDLMFTAVRLGKTTFEELSSSLFNVNPIAAATGVEFGNVTAALASMTAQGVPTSVATTQLRQLLVELSKDGTKASDAFKEAAGVGMQEFLDQGGDLNSVLEVMQQAAGDNDVALQDMFGSVEAGAAALALSGDNAEKFQENLAAMQGAAGSTDQAFAVMEGTTAARMEKVSARINEAFLKIGEMALPALEGILTLFDQLMPHIETGIETIAAFFDGGSEGASKFSGFMSDMMETVGPILEGIGEMFQSAGELIMAVWDLVGNELLAIWGFLWDSILNVLGNAITIVTGIFDGVKALLTGDWEGLKEALLSIWDALWDAVANVMENAKEILGLILSAVWTLLQGILETMWEGILEGWNKLSDWFGGLGQTVKDAIGDLGNLLLDVGRNIIQGLIDGVKSMIPDLGSVFSGLTNMIPEWKGPETVDEQLLTPAGVKIMQGLMAGIHSEIPALESQLSAITGDISTDLAAVPVTAAGGPGGLSSRTTFPTTVILELDGRVLAETVTDMQHDEVRLRLGRRLG